MTLQECLKRLARGKLSNLALAKGGVIDPAQLDKVIDAVNEGISRIYTQLPIKEKSVIVELYEGRTEYPLSSEHSLRNWKGELYDDYDYYIRDTDENPFEDDIQTILEIWDDLDRKRPLNDPDNPLSVFTPEPSFISVNEGIQNRVLNIVYRPKHKLLTAGAMAEKIGLPANLEGALLSYAAYLIHSDMNGETAVANAQKYFAEYQTIISEVIQHGSITPDKLVSDLKFIRRGWV